MSDATMLKKPKVKSLATQTRRLQQRLEDLEDFIELRCAIERNAGEPGGALKVKAELDFHRSELNQKRRKKQEIVQTNFLSADRERSITKVRNLGTNRRQQILGSSLCR